MSYTYDPTQIGTQSVSRARFELGDIKIDGGEETCFLSDEEIQAIIDSTPRWKAALFRLADAVCMRLSFETDWKNDDTSINLNQRAERWVKMRDKLKEEADMEATLPVSGAVSDSIQSSDGGHYFRRGMQKSPYVIPPYPDYIEGDP